MFCTNYSCHIIFFSLKSFVFPLSHFVTLYVQCCKSVMYKTKIWNNNYLTRVVRHSYVSIRLTGHTIIQSDNSIVRSVWGHDDFIGCRPDTMIYVNILHFGVNRDTTLGTLQTNTAVQRPVGPYKDYSEFGK